MEQYFFFTFIFFYPLFMAIFWMTGAIIYVVRREQHEVTPPKLKSYPRVAILVPCHNEESCIKDNIEQLLGNKYPTYEIIAINDGSTDKTGQILAELCKRSNKLRVVTLTKNYGKAMALKAGALACNAEFLMCIDADALLDKFALFWMLQHFEDGPRVGAVTGNPRVMNRTGLLARIQMGEFSAIIGMVKRTQRNIGRLFTVSGVNACFRLAALHDVGYWSSDTVTEDIDISWKLQLRYWDIRYEPQALTWILVPDTIKSLWNQRLRWAKGGVEAATTYAKDIFHWHSRRMWVVYFEYWLTVVWCYAFGFTVLCWAGTHLLPGIWPEAISISTLVPRWTGVLLALVCLLQFAMGLAIDSHYERRGLFRYLFWAIWYPAFYWIINAATTIVAVPKGLFEKGKTKYAVWTSPSRRLQSVPRKIRFKNTGDDHREYFQKLIPQHPKKIAEVIVTLVSWSLWVYLITPLLSVLLWLAGTYLFVEKIILPRYDQSLGEIAYYGGAILGMWVLLAAWIFWNQVRYGRNNRRNVDPPYISNIQMSELMGLESDVVEKLKKMHKVFLHFDDAGLPIIEEESDFDETVDKTERSSNQVYSMSEAAIKARNR